MNIPKNSFVVIMHPYTLRMLTIIYGDQQTTKAIKEISVTRYKLINIDTMYLSRIIQIAKESLILPIAITNVILIVFIFAFVMVDPKSESVCELFERELCCGGLSTFDSCRPGKSIEIEAIYI